MPEFTGHHDFRTYLRILWRWKFLFLVFLLAVPVAAFLIERGKPKMYKSSALVGINQATVNTALLNGSGSFSTANVLAIAQLVTTTPVARVAAHQLHPPGNPSQIVGEVSASGDPNTNFLTITAQDHNAQRAADVANAFAKAISNNRQQAAIAELNNAIKGVQRQLSHLGRGNSATRQTLQAQLSQLKAAEATQGTNAAILQSATPSGTPVGLDARRSVEIGLVIGLLLAFGAVALAENADRRLRSPDDLQGMTDLPVLTAIPASAFSGKLETRPEDNESFSMLRTALMFFNVDRKLDSVIITSAGEQEGKTTVASRLALTAARAGQHVILVDADLRRAQVSSRLKIDAPAGLGAVLAEERPLHDVLFDYPIEHAGDGSLTVLPAGPPPPNAPALLSSQAMERVLRDLEAESDLVIIDTPAALAVSDPIPLMRQVTGVVLVARMNRSSRETIKRLKGIITAAHGNLLGVVATGVGGGPGYEHYSPKYYTQNGNRRSRTAKRSAGRGWLRGREQPADPQVSVSPDA